MRWLLLLILASPAVFAESAFEKEFPEDFYIQHLFNQGVEWANQTINDDVACEEQEFTTEEVSAADVLSPRAKHAGKLSVITEAQLSKLMNKVKSLKYIPYEFNIDGCYARAHEMAKVIEAEGVKSGKVFVYARPGDYFEIPSKYTSSGIVRPQSHASVLVMVKSASGVEPYVIDPSISSVPIKLSVFERKFHVKAEGNSPQRIQFHNRFAYAVDPKNKSFKPVDDWQFSDGKATSNLLAALNESKMLYENGNCSDVANIFGRISSYDNTRNIREYCKGYARSKLK